MRSCVSSAKVTSAVDALPVLTVSRETGIEAARAAPVGAPISTEFCVCVRIASGSVRVGAARGRRSTMPGRSLCGGRPSEGLFSSMRFVRRTSRYIRCAMDAQVSPATTR